MLYMLPFLRDWINYVIEELDAFALVRVEAFVNQWIEHDIDYLFPFGAFESNCLQQSCKQSASVVAIASSNPSQVGLE